MKILLSLLGVITIGASPVVGIASAESTMNNRSKSESDFNVPFEMLKHKEIMEVALKDKEQFKTEQEILELFVNGLNMLDEVSNESFFWEMHNLVSELIIVYKSELKQIKYDDDTAYSIFSNKNNLIGNTFSIKNDEKFRDAFLEYEKAKAEEAKDFFTYYDQEITGLNKILIEKQSKINQLNVRNAELNSILEGLTKENEILSELISVVNFSQKMVKNIKEILDNAIYNVDSHYESANWHSDHWAMSLIPFYGIGFNIKFKKEMDFTLRGINTFMITFGNSESEQGKQFIEMQKEMKGIREKLLDIDPGNNDFIGKILDETDLNPIVLNGINAAIDAGYKALAKLPAGIGTVVNEILEMIGAGFNAKKLSNKFKNELTEHYEFFEDPAYKMKNNVDNSMLALNTALNKFYSSLKSNDSQSEKLLKELKNNQKEIELLNVDLNGVTNKIKELNTKITKSLDVNLMSDYRYFYYGNQMSDIELNNRKHVGLEELKQINAQKQTKYDALIRLLDELPSGEVQDSLISKIIDKNKNSNIGIDIITK